ncbi:MAG: hypothetical protein U0165_19020 [Polyangiaceae bacterium]
MSNTSLSATTAMRTMSNAGQARWWARALVVVAGVAATLAVGCATSGSEGPKPQVQRGPKYTATLPARVLLLPPLCVTVDGACDDRATSSLVTRVTKELTEHGAFVIDGATMLDDARIRADADPPLRALALKLGPPTPVPPSAPSPYEQLTTADYSILLRNAQATSMVALRISVGPKEGINQRLNTVLLRFVQGDATELIWQSQCSSPSAVIPTLQQSLEVATDCALNGIFHPDQVGSSSTAKPTSTPASTTTPTTPAPATARPATSSSATPRR